LANDQVYHVFNKSIDGRKIFKFKRELTRATINLWYYRFYKPPIPLSKYLLLSFNRQVEYHNVLLDSQQIVTVLAYCLMPNHFHILVRQKNDQGISKYLANIQNSYTKYYNQVNQRKGPLFLNRFRAVRIESDEQLLHVSRYIHLNPVTSYLLKEPRELDEYSWSSWDKYMSGNQRIYQICETDEILGMVGGREKYEQFVFDQAEYQRKLKEISSIILE